MQGQVGGKLGHQLVLLRLGDGWKGELSQTNAGCNLQYRVAYGEGLGWLSGQYPRVIGWHCHKGHMDIGQEEGC